MGLQGLLAPFKKRSKNFVVTGWQIEHVGIALCYEKQYFALWA
jgi:hypothetical protein